MPKRRRRFSMQFGYDARPSFWQNVKSNSHLIIAAVGTVALLGVAGTAFWLAMPAGDRQAFAQIEPTVAVDEAAAGAEPAGVQAIGRSAAAEAAPGPAAEAPDDPAGLSAGDPRWSGSTRKQGRTPAKAALEADKEAATVAVAPPPLPTPEQAASVAAYQDEPESGDRSASDGARTAAIPTPRPDVPEAREEAGEKGHILRAVTMRSGPKKAASALGTVPAGVAVEVVSCKSWCEIVYEGKRGFIYKSFLKRGG
jgi:hypothetical protein